MPEEALERLYATIRRILARGGSPADFAAVEEDSRSVAAAPPTDRDGRAALAFCESALVVLHARADSRWLARPVLDRAAISADAAWETASRKTPVDLRLHIWRQRDFVRGALHGADWLARAAPAERSRDAEALVEMARTVVGGVRGVAGAEPKLRRVEQILAILGALAERSQGEAWQVGFHLVESRYWNVRFDLAKDPAHLTVAEAAAREAVQIAANFADPQQEGDARASLAHVLSRAPQWSRDAVRAQEEVSAEAQRATACFRAAARLAREEREGSPPGSLEAKAASAREHDAQQAELDSMTVHLRSSAYLASRTHRPEDGRALAAALAEYLENPRVAPLSRAVRARASAAEGLAPTLTPKEAMQDDGLRGKVLDAIALAQGALFTVALRREILDDAVLFGEASVEAAVGIATIARPGRLSRQASRRGSRYRWYGDAEDYHASVLLLEAAIAEYPPQADGRDAARLTLLGLHRTRARYTNDPKDLREAIDLAREIARDENAGDHRRARAFDNSAILRLDGGDVRGALADTREAVRLGAGSEPVAGAEDDATAGGDSKGLAGIVREARFAMLSCMVDAKDEASANRLEKLVLRWKDELPVKNAVDLLAMLGRALLAVDRPARAAAAFREAVERARSAQSKSTNDPDLLAHASLLNGLPSLVGYAYCAAGMFAEAVEAIERGISSVLKGVGDSSRSEGAGVVRVPVGHTLAYVGSSSDGSFVLWSSGGDWSGVALPKSDSDIAKALQRNRRGPSDRSLVANGGAETPAEEGFDPFTTLSSPGASVPNPAWLTGVASALEAAGISRALAHAASGSGSVTLVPLGLLRAVPFHALPSEAGGLLFGGKSVTYSLTAAMSSTLSTSFRELVLAHPVGVPPHRAISPAWCTETMTSDVRGVASVWTEADSSALRRGAATGPAIVRLGCHAKFHPTVPLASYLQLADGDFTARDVSETLDLSQTRLVALTACESAVADNRLFTDEGFGLTHAFLHAGAGFVASTLWPVDALLATLLDHHLARNLREGMAPVDAHHAAIRKLRGLTAGEWREEIAALALRQAELLRGIPSGHPAAGNAQQTSEVIAKFRRWLDGSLASGRFGEKDVVLASRPELTAPFVITHLGPAPAS